MSVIGVKNDSLLQLLAQNVTEHQLEVESGSFFLLTNTLGLVFCILLS